MQSSFEKAIEDAVRRAYISGRTGESLTRRMNDAVRQAVKEYGAKATLRAGKDYAKKVVSQLDAESLKVFSTDKDIATKAMKNSSKLVMDFAKRLDKVDEKASKNIIKAITSLNPNETDWRTAARAAMQKAGLAKHHAKTEIETFAGAMDRARVIDTALEGGIRRFKYVGPSGTQRPFCKGKVGVTFGIDAIKGMDDNGQGLPGIYYCGGYNCRHRWVPVLEGERKIQEGAKPKPHEFETADKLMKYGMNVEFVPESKISGVKMYDAILTNTNEGDSDTAFNAEFKSAKNVKNPENHIIARLKECEEKQATVMVLDITQDDYDLPEIIECLKMHNKKYIYLKKIFFLFNGKIQKLNI